MESDRRRHELERLLAMGREPGGEPSARQLLIARTIEPSAWSEHAEEHVSWCGRYGLLGSQTHFGAQFVVMRRLALIKAADVMRATARHEAGLPDLRPFDASAVSKRLGKVAFDMYREARPRRHVHHEPAREVFFLKAVDGIPEPGTHVEADGAVVLTWSEGDRSAVLRIGTDKSAVLTIAPSDRDPQTLDLHSHRADHPRILAAATDWIYHGCAHPHADEDAAEEPPTDGDPT